MDQTQVINLRGHLLLVCFVLHCIIISFSNTLGIEDCSQGSTHGAAQGVPRCWIAGVLSILFWGRGGCQVIRQSPYPCFPSGSPNLVATFLLHFCIYFRYCLTCSLLEWNICRRTWSKMVNSPIHQVVHNISPKPLVIMFFIGLQMVYCYRGQNRDGVLYCYRGQNRDGIFNTFLDVLESINIENVKFIKNHPRSIYVQFEFSQVSEKKIFILIYIGP